MTYGSFERRLTALEKARRTLYAGCPGIRNLSDEELEAEVCRILGDDPIETPAGTLPFRDADRVSRMRHVRQVLETMP